MMHCTREASGLSEFHRHYVKIRVKVKLSMHGRNVHEGGKAWLHAFLISLLGGVQWPGARAGHFMTRKKLRLPTD